MTPPIVSSVSQTREQLDNVRRAGKRIGMVPTMGALHAGHASLIQRARSECDFVVVSIFVNPLQFGPTEDYQRYPRPVEKDVALCAEIGVDLIFAPETSEMYVSPQITFVEVTRITDYLCGAFRPGHFRGVATVVLKLFNIVQPDFAYFGEKDYQQLCVIRRMVEDFNLRVTIVPVPTHREPDGLAMSSRNVYLSAEERAAAPALYRSLKIAQERIAAGESDVEKIKADSLRLLAAPLIRVQYFEVVDPDDLQPVEIVSGPVRIAAAIFIGKTRLIDNVSAGDEKHS
ncbi:MAG TPA: pantoate--beta-alanine ligase [Terriglobia bacterium]|nr:pantoate--beta-alanine ligase [Terriglobia bacterium]